jgi:hypothetical protein
MCRRQVKKSRRRRLRRSFDRQRLYLLRFFILFYMGELPFCPLGSQNCRFVPSVADLVPRSNSRLPFGVHLGSRLPFGVCCVRRCCRFVLQRCIVGTTCMPPNGVVSDSCDSWGHPSLRRVEGAGPAPPPSTGCGSGGARTPRGPSRYGRLDESSTRGSRGRRL